MTMRSVYHHHIDTAAAKAAIRSGVFGRYTHAGAHSSDLVILGALG